jgi:hypothetical protein
LINFPQQLYAQAIFVKERLSQLFAQSFNLDFCPTFFPQQKEKFDFSQKKFIQPLPLGGGVLASNFRTSKMGKSSSSKYFEH